MSTLRAKIAASVLTVLTLGAIVGNTQPTPNDLGLDLPMAVQGVPESPVIMRIGTVSDIQEATSVTVKISGSPTLVNASYLFPQYQPILGDRVVVLRQNSQWAVMGTFSGVINTQIFNPSFELGADGALPTGWSFAVTSSGAGSPTLVKDVALNPIEGTRVARWSLGPTGLGSSSAQLRSTPIPATEGSRWVGAIYVQLVEMVGPNSVLMSTSADFLDGGGAVITSFGFSNAANFSSSAPTWTLLRPDVLFPVAVAPTGTASVRLSVDLLFTVANASFSNDGYFDYAILRQVD